jgi:light-regulated signal transduction histidine kinase (bacteriophytochrome)
MKGWIGKSLKVDVDDEARRLVQEGVKHRREIQKGAEFAMVISVIAEHGGKITRQLLFDRLLKYGLDWREAGELISEMLRLHLIGFDGQRVYLK